MKAQELRDTLIGLGYTQEQLLDGKGYKLKRPALCEKLQEHNKGEEGLEVMSNIAENSSDGDSDVETVINGGLPDAKDYIKDSDSDTDEPELEETDPPTPSSPEWTQYVLGKFLQDEVDGSNPRVEGLRRVACELVGELIEEGCDLIAAPTEENRFRACVKAWGVFITPEGRTKRFEALADAHSDNCLEDYATYLVAMADTRAKGRMYRNALFLKRVVAAEEVSKTMAAVDDVQPGGKIHVGQITLIRMMADRHDFKITEILDGMGMKYELNDQTGEVNLKSLSYEDAVATSSRMREMASEKDSK
jgi:hypothetical protein